MTAGTDACAVDAELYAILAVLRRHAGAHDAHTRRCLIVSDCKPAMQAVEAAWRRGKTDGLREWDRGHMLEAICEYRKQLEGVCLVWTPAHEGVAMNAYADMAAKAYTTRTLAEDVAAEVAATVRTTWCVHGEERKGGGDDGKTALMMQAPYAGTRRAAAKKINDEAGARKELWSAPAKAAMR